MENKQKFKPDPKLKLMDQVRQDLIGKTEIGIFLSSLPTRDQISASIHPAAGIKCHVMDKNLASVQSPLDHL